ncbi:efflux RND transporter periplasmic adaptor subunit [Weeksellaceae bacterium A-14]|uniref:efflux RND transporter periplasmic adaptor subunit n=1 Tax=Daejeonia sp. YH14 TaxID=3439042 RepID=UPI0031E4A982
MKRVALCVALGMLCFLSSCSKKEEAPEESTYQTTSPLQQDTVVTKDYTAQIQSAKNIEIRAQEKGFLEKIFVDEGQYVKAGQPLFRIMPQMYQAELLKARAEVEQAQIELQNASTLAKNNIVSKNERAMAKAKLDGALAEQKLAQLHLSFTDVRAPFSGIINRIPLKLGSLIDEGDLLTTLSDNNGVFAYFNVSEPEYLSYQLHANERGSDQVSLILANGDMMPEKGYIKNIEGEFDSETGNIAFRAQFPNPKQLLKNGETGKVRMKVPVSHALIIPQKATYEVQDQTYVFVVDAKGKVASRNIKTGYQLPDIYTVVSGLSPKDHILLEGIQKVKDGQTVKTRFIAPRTALQSLKLKAE